MVHVQRIRACRVLSPKWDVFILHPLLPRLREHCGRGDGKMVEAEVMDACKETVITLFQKITFLLLEYPGVIGREKKGLFF